VRGSRDVWTIFGAVVLPVGILLLLTALAFGTTGVVFGALIAAMIGIVVLIGYALMRGEARTSQPGELGGPARPSGAPVSGEGSGSPLAAPGPRPE
jgi:hypothetical protein